MESPAAVSGRLVRQSDRTNVVKVGMIALRDVVTCRRGALGDVVNVNIH
jgi:hypothetical protein